MTWLALRALLARVPGIVWAFAFAASFAVAAWFAAVHIGERRGEVKVQRVAAADSVVHVTAKLDSVRHRSDSLIHVATVAKVASDTGRARTRAVLEAHLSDTPPDVVQAVDAQLARDSLTIAVQAAPIPSLLAERPIEEKRDSLRINQVALGTPKPASHHLRDAATGAAVAAILYGILKAVTK